jgi:hypothetical protein
MKTKELRKPNLMCNANEKTSKTKVQIERWNDQISKKSTIHPQAQVGTYEHAMGIKKMSKMMLEKKWSCNLFKIFSQS